jgi:hypothetical protein
MHNLHTACDCYYYLLLQIVAGLDVPMWEPSGEKIDLSDGKDKPDTAAATTAADDTASDGGVAESKSNGDLQRQS